MSKKHQAKTDEPVLTVSIVYRVRMKDGPTGESSTEFEVEGAESLVKLVRSYEELFRPISRLLSTVADDVLTGNLEPTAPTHFSPSSVGRA